MAYAEELLQQAFHLAGKDPDPPKEASLRRAVSTGYYALFHLLIGDAVINWSREKDRAQLGRVFEHRRMKTASKEILDRKPATPDPVLDRLKKIAKTFVRLQEKRESADYDNSKSWTRDEVDEELFLVSEAFETWALIRYEDAAQDYLVSFLLKR